MRFNHYELKEWYTLDPVIRDAEIHASFRNIHVNFKRPTGTSTYKIHDRLNKTVD